MQDAPTSMVPAHTEHLRLDIYEAIPAHEPRETDKHYAIFNQTRARLVKLGALKCWIDNANCTGDVELHHDKAEFAFLNSIDAQAFARAYGLHFGNDEDFLNYVEGEGNLLCLCVYHHRSHGGIHVLPYPVWVIQKYMKAGVLPAAIEGTPTQSASANAAADIAKDNALVDAAVPINERL